MDPPTYAAASSLSRSRDDGDNNVSAPPALLNLVPMPGEASFQQGYLGYTDTSLRGTLQIKFTSSDPSSYRSTVTKVTVEFAGLESVTEEDGSEIELAREIKTLWERDSRSPDLGPSDGSNSFGASGSGPPGSLNFDIRLTDDLPNCCHIGSGSIVYTLKARLHTASKDVLAITNPVHLSRTSPPLDSPQSASFSTQAEIYSAEHPTEVYIFFPHGTANFRRSESIELRVRMPPPDAALVQEKGLKLRSISAQLHRQVSLRINDNEDQEITALLETPALDTLISHSGKAAAFSSSRSIFLNLWLQPVPADFCESITQSTIVIDIKFSVRVIASFQGRSGDRQEVVVFDKPVTIIPDYPPATAQDSTPALPAARFSSSGDKASPHASTSSTGRVNPDLLRAFQEETEYDGYEEFSEEADPDDAPPNIDADQPPPALEPSSSVPAVEVPFDPPPPPTPSLLRTTPLSTLEAADEAPPYSSTAITSADVPSIAVATAVETGQRLPEHHDHHNDSAALPPPPYGEAR